jgi:DNA-binding beta-propeller fold protein YncE
MTHGINVAKDNSQICVAQESTASLLVVDGKTLQITKRIPLSGSPNLVQLTPDGKRMYVSINLRWDVASNFPRDGKERLKCMQVLKESKRTCDTISISE